MLGSKEHCRRARAASSLAHAALRPRAYLLPYLSPRSRRAPSQGNAPAPPRRGSLCGTRGAPEVHKEMQLCRIRSAGRVPPSALQLSRAAHRAGGGEHTAPPAVPLPATPAHARPASAARTFRGSQSACGWCSSAAATTPATHSAWTTSTASAAASLAAPAVEHRDPAAITCHASISESL